MPARKRRSLRNPPPASETLPRIAGALRVSVESLRDQYESLAGERVGATSERGPVTMEVTLRGITVSFRPSQGGSRVRVQMPLPRASFGAGSSDPVRPRPAAIVAPNFADKVETLARHIESVVRASTEANFARSGKSPPAEAYQYSAITIEPSRKYWYLRNRYGGRRWAVEVETGEVFPMDSRGPMTVGVSIDNMGAYDWASNRYLPPKLPSPLPVRWVRSSLPSPKKSPPRAKTIPLRTADNEDPRDWSGRSDRGSSGERTGRGQSGYGEFHGSKYGTCGKGGVEIAKCVRKDIANAERKGWLPRGIETSVRAEYSKIDVTIVRVPGVLVVNPEFAEEQQRDPYFSGGGFGKPRIERYTPAGNAIIAEIEHILSTYNRDNSDLQSDYHDVAFYTHVNFDSRLVAQQTGDIIAKRDGSERRDEYLTTDLRDAIKASGRSGGPEAYSSKSGWRVVWLDSTGKVLSEAEVSSPQDAYEYVLSWNEEYSKRKAEKNGRRSVASRATKRRRTRR